MVKERDYRISNIRALAIMIVVLGHSIIIYDTNWGYYTAKYQSEMLQSLKHIINYFQMPLFFSISGYCYNFSTRKIKNYGYTAFVKGKAKRLLVPFASIAILWMIPLRLVSKYPYWQGKTLKLILWEIISGYDSGHLWYLICLFWIFLIAGVLTIAKAKIRSTGMPAWASVTIVLIALTGIAFVAPEVPRVFFLQDVAKYLMWFYYGHCLYSNAHNSKDKTALLIIVSTAIIIVMGLAASRITDAAYSSQFMKSNIVGVLITGFIYMWMPVSTCKPVRVITDNSYGIYLFHSPLIYPVFCYLSWLRPVFVIALTFGVMFPLALAITLALKKTKKGKYIIGEG